VIFNVIFYKFKNKDKNINRERRREEKKKKNTAIQDSLNKKIETREKKNVTGQRKLAILKHFKKKPLPNI
jgi:hypothetical protein